MRLRAALSAAVLAGAATACTGGGGGTTHAAPPPGQVVAKAETPPLPIGATPLWSERTKGVPRYADGFAVHGDSVVAVSGPKGGEADRLSVLDAATGKVRWSVGIWKPLRGGHGDAWDGPNPSDGGPQLVDRGGDWGVLVTTVRGQGLIQKGYGQALLSGRDGRVLWRRPLVAAKKSSGPKGYVYPSALATDGRLAVMSLRPSALATVADVRLVAVDARTGKRLWTRTGILLTAVAAGSVLAAESRVPASTPLSNNVDQTLTVLDATTGRTRWSLRGRMATARVAAVATGLVLVREEQNGLLKAPVLLDLATGAQLGRLPDQTGNCTSDRGDLIACDVLFPDPHLFTVRADERRVRVAGRKPPDGTIDQVQDGRIYFWNLKNPGQEVDRSGTPLTGPLPAGILAALSDEYAVFRLPDTEQYRVYRVG
jgi:outer membrane protein assembly factor BamB